MKRGLVIGKFYPPHNGHIECINQSVKNTDETTVVICDNGQTPTALDRAIWLHATCPDITIRIVKDICEHAEKTCPKECSQKWADHLKNNHIETDSVWGSEPYIIPFAKAMNAQPHIIDIDRQNIPISATEIRNNLKQNWHHLPKPVQTGLRQKIVVIGAESTGTTTLTTQLAHKLDTIHIPEYGRWKTDSAANETTLENIEWTAGMFWEIAQKQTELTYQTLNNYHKPADMPLILVDTDTLATCVWAERYLGYIPEGLTEYAAANRPYAYIITSPKNVLFEQDGLRDGEHLRHQMHQRIEHMIQQTDVPYLIVEGTARQRVEQAVAWLETQQQTRPLFQPTNNNT